MLQESDKLKFYDMATGQVLSEYRYYVPALEEAWKAEMEFMRACIEDFAGGICTLAIDCSSHTKPQDESQACGCGMTEDAK